MQASDTCIAAIEGWEGCELSVYKDLNGFPTIGYGHKLTSEEIADGVYADGITQEQAYDLMTADLLPAEVTTDPSTLTPIPEV